MPEITVGDWEDTDLDEVASLTFDALQGSPFSSPERSLEDVEGWLNWNRERFPPAAVFQAHVGGGLVGWLTVTVDVKPRTSETWRWVPYISPEVRGQEDGIARGLIRRCKEYVVERGQTRLEACFDRARAEHDVVLPPGYWYVPMVDADEEALYDCYSQSFAESGVRSYHNMTEEERRAEYEYYFREAAVNEKASLVVLRGDEIVGFSLVHSRQKEAHLADIGIVPAHRGRGLGRRMLMHSLMNAAGEYDNVTLAVDVDNTSAYDLYSDLGFDVVYRIITHA